MIAVGVIFATLLGWLLFINRKAQKVKQFNIVLQGSGRIGPKPHIRLELFCPLSQGSGLP